MVAHGHLEARGDMVTPGRPEARDVAVAHGPSTQGDPQGPKWALDIVTIPEVMAASPQEVVKVASPQEVVKVASPQEMVKVASLQEVVTAASCREDQMAHLQVAVEMAVRPKGVAEAMGDPMARIPTSHRGEGRFHQDPLVLKDPQVHQGPQAALE